MYAPKQLFLIAALLTPLIAGADFDPHNPPNTCDRNTIVPWMQSWRQLARMNLAQGFANDFKQVPEKAPGAVCIKGLAGAEFVPSGNYYHITCMAKNRGVLSHFLEIDYNIDPDPACLSDDSFNNFAAKICQNNPVSPNNLRNYVNGPMSACGIRANIRSQPNATPADPIKLARLLNDWHIDKGTVVDDSWPPKVKGSPSTGGSGGNDDPGCAVFGCSKVNNSGTVK